MVWWNTEREIHLRGRAPGPLPTRAKLNDRGESSDAYRVHELETAKTSWLFVFTMLV